eukprot:XP_011661150.1 PREDICTED: RNA polymerase II elongation factor ELL-like [Strongylocentrotus purpuratus]
MVAIQQEFFSFCLKSCRKPQESSTIIIKCNFFLSLFSSFMQYSTSKRPSIQFKGNSGVITFPSTEAKDGEREFKFTVQPLQQTSSFESIQHYRNSRGEHKLDSLGSIQTKVTVSGTDDVYQTTQKKMKLADEEMKKVSTKEVKQNQFLPGSPGQAEIHLGPCQDFHLIIQYQQSLSIFQFHFVLFHVIEL